MNSQNIQEKDAKIKDRASDLILIEFQQAWLHYRHVMSSREKYLGFFFTISMGYIGFSITIYNEIIDHGHDWSVLLFLILSCIVFSIDLVLLASVLKMKNVLSHYINVWKQIRNDVYGVDNGGYEYLDIYHSDNAPEILKAFKNHNLIIYIMSVTSLLVFLVQMGTVIISYNALSIMLISIHITVIALTCIFPIYNLSFNLAKSNTV